MDDDCIILNPTFKYPYLCLPKESTNLILSSKNSNMMLSLTIKSQCADGNERCVYSGLCEVQFVDLQTSFNTNDTSNGADSGPMSVITMDMENETPSHVWIDPTRSPYVYNQSNDTQPKSYSPQTSISNNLTVAQHNTYITQTIYNCSNNLTDNTAENLVHNKIGHCNVENYFKPNHDHLYEDNEYECGVMLSQLSKEIINQNENKSKQDKRLIGIQTNNEALNQLMSPKIQSLSKQQRTILFLGQTAESGQTVQKISVNDPLIKCSGPENAKPEIINDMSSTPKKKRYQCDKCKQIFDQIMSFKKHIGDHKLNYKENSAPDSNSTDLVKVKVTCMECGRNFRNKDKFEMHCMGHGDPEVECNKCHKVFASKFTLRAHRKLHNRKYNCKYCCETYSDKILLKSHLNMMHSDLACSSSLHKKGIHNSNKLLESSTSPSLNKRKTSADFINKDINILNSPEKRNLFLQESGYVSIEDDIIGMASRWSELTTSDDNTTKFENDVFKSKNSSDSSDKSNDYVVINDDKDFTYNNSSYKNSVESIPENNNKTKFFIGGQDDSDFVIESKSEASETLDPYDISIIDGDTGESNNCIPLQNVKIANAVIAKVMKNKAFLGKAKKAKRNKNQNKVCDVCLKSFDRIGDLKRHLIEHIVRSSLTKSTPNRSGILSITCEVCQLETFSKLDKYKAHLREHAKLTIYKCTFCDKSFSDSSNFSKHKKIHGTPYFQCDLCSRKFNSKKMITQHMEYHVKNSPIPCKYCKKVFYFKSMLNKHMKCAHVSNHPRMKCRFCDASSFSSLKLKWDHEWKVHHIRKMIVDCFICDAKFRKYSELKKHTAEAHCMGLPKANNYLGKLN